ncbi:MAG: hypothetical protein IJC83_03230 [Oscillospiraceae bacterium]|nr:hypothetical protein [Oscillospiraceae bacterium]
MTKAKERYKRFSNAVDGFIINNPVLSRGLGIASIVVASGTLKNAVALSLAFFIVVIPTLFFASLMKDRLQSWIRAFVYAFIASIFYPLAYLAVSRLFTSQIRIDLGIYLPLTILNTIIIYRAERCAIKSKPHIAIWDGFLHGFGYVFTLCGIAVIREVVGRGTIWGQTLSFVTRPISGVSLPFFGFILLGVLSALYHKAGAMARKFVAKLDREKVGEDL